MPESVAQRPSQRVRKSSLARRFRIRSSQLPEPCVPHIIELPGEVAEKIDRTGGVYGFVVVWKISTKGRESGERILVLYKSLLIMLHTDMTTVSRAVHPSIVKRVGWCELPNKLGIRVTLFFEENQPSWVFEAIDHKWNRSGGITVAEFLTAISDVRSIYRDDAVPMMQHQSKEDMWKQTDTDKSAVPPVDQQKASLSAKTKERAHTTAARHEEVMSSPNLAPLVVQNSVANPSTKRLEPVTITLHRKDGEPYGLEVVVLVITHVVPGSFADRAGAGKYLAWTIYEVDHVHICTEKAFRDRIAGKNSVTLKLSPPSKKERKWAEDMMSNPSMSPRVGFTSMSPQAALPSALPAPVEMPGTPPISPAPSAVSMHPSSQDDMDRDPEPLFMLNVRFEYARDNCYCVAEDPHDA